MRTSLLVVLCFQVVHCLPEIGAFSSTVNIEKLYTMEDEMISLTDVILRLERHIHGDDDVHGLYNVTEIVTKVKEIHRDIISNKTLASYVSHPVNMLHLTKRLAKNWSKVIAILENSKSCAKDMRVKIENMADNLPTGKDVQMISHGILRLQAMYNISASDVMSGKIFETSSFAPFSLDDAFDLARIAYEIGYYFLAVDWLNVVTSQYDKDTASFDITNAINLMSSAYLKLQQPTQALATLGEVLKQDPKNVVAHRNSRYIVLKQTEGLIDTQVDHQVFKRKKDQMLQKMCSNKTQVSRGHRQSFCTYTGLRGAAFFDRPSIQTEVLSIKPLIVVYYNYTTASQLKAIKHMGYEQMIDSMSKKRYSKPGGLSGMTVKDRTSWKWVPGLKEALESIHLTERFPYRSDFVVRNIGLDGHENTQLDRSERTRLGTFLVFLSEPQHGGGHVVFPKLKTKVIPRQGDVLFYERTAHRQASICPVISDALWVGVYPLHEPMYNHVCFKDNMIRPKP